MSRLTGFIAAILILICLAASLWFYRPTAPPLPKLTDVIAPLETPKNAPNPFRAYLLLNGRWEARWEGDNKWNSVPVPGVWESDPQVRVPPIEYRRSFRLPAAWKNKRIFLRLGGCTGRFQAAVNGVSVGKARSWGLPSDIELTRRLTFDTSNLLELLVETEPKDDPMLMFRNWKPPAGIACDVFLEAVPATFIRSVSVITSITPGGDGEISIEGEIDGELPETAALMGWIVAPDGKPVLSFEKNVGAGFKPAPTPAVREREEFEVKGLLEGATRWSPSAPKLYRTDVLLVLPGDTDGVSVPIGFRSYEASGNDFLLNGKKTRLRGVTYYNDVGASPGKAVQQLRSDLKLIRSSGWNAVRFIPSVVSEETLNECDRLGLFVLEELPLAHLPAGSLQNAETLRFIQEQFTKMIRTHYHHPSVVMWGISGNLPAQLPEMEVLVKRIVEYADFMDSPLIYAGAEHLKNNPIVSLLPVAALNYSRGAIHRAHKKPLVILGYGAEAVGGRRSAGASGWSEEYQARVMRSMRNYIEREAQAAGSFLHSFADYPDASAAFSAVPFMRLTGLFTRDRAAKLAFDAAAPAAARQSHHIAVARTTPLPSRNQNLVEILLLVFLFPVGIVIWIFTGELRPIFTGAYPADFAAPSIVSITRPTDVPLWMEEYRGGVPRTSFYRPFNGLLVWTLTGAAISISLRTIAFAPFAPLRENFLAEILPSGLTPFAVALLNSPMKLLHFSLVFAGVVVMISALINSIFLRQNALMLAALFARLIIPFVFVPVLILLPMPLSVAFIIPVMWSLFLMFRTIARLFRVRTVFNLLLLLLSPTAVAVGITVLVITL
ncbi:MAG: glycoside hydrolase family 2 TIM barrel-domain containing protein [bacterium]